MKTLNLKIMLYFYLSIFACIILSKLSFSVFELMGTFAFAYNGAKSGIEYADRLDKSKIKYAVSVAFICAFGGGFFIRDLLLLQRIPALFTNYAGILVAFLGTIYALFLNKVFCKYDFKNKESCKYNFIQKAFSIWDYVGMAVFVMCGYMASNENGSTSPLLNAVCGLVSGCGGGMLASIILFKCDRSKLINSINYFWETCYCGLLLVFFNRLDYQLRCVITSSLCFYTKEYSNFIKYYLRILIHKLISYHSYTNDIGIKYKLLVSLSLNDTFKYITTQDYFNRMAQVKTCNAHIVNKFFYYRRAFRTF